MRVPNTGMPASHRSESFHIFRGPEADLADQGRQLVSLIDDWLKSQEECGPNARAARRAERRLHLAIKSGPLFGKILSFAGLNLWVDDRTSEGLVDSQESISL